jgi:hypothetical protein
LYRKSKVSHPLFGGGLGPMFFLMRDLNDATAGYNPWAIVGPASEKPNSKNPRDAVALQAVFGFWFLNFLRHSSFVFSVSTAVRA